MTHKGGVSRLFCDGDTKRTTSQSLSRALPANSPSHSCRHAVCSTANSGKMQYNQNLSPRGKEQLFVTFPSWVIVQL